MDRQNIIQIKHLCKSFKEVKAVDDLSFCVKKGELFAFLGVNGAGKSTTISIICNRLKKDSGEVYINGNNVDEGVPSVKKNLGVVFQNSVLDTSLSVKRQPKKQSGALRNYRRRIFKAFGRTGQTVGRVVFV